MAQRIFQTPHSLGLLLKLYKANRSLTDISRSLNCHHTTVIYHIGRLHLKRDDKRTVEDLVAFANKTSPPLPPPREFEARFKPASWMERPKTYRQYVRDAGYKLVKNCYGIYTVKRGEKQDEKKD